MEIIVYTKLQPNYFSFISDCRTNIFPYGKIQKTIFHEEQAIDKARCA